MKRFCMLSVLLVLTFMSYAQSNAGDVEMIQQARESMADQPRRSPKDIAEYQTLMLRRDLDLTDEQAEKVFAVNLKYAQLGRPQNRQQAEERMKQKLSDLKAILTEEQYETFMKKTSEIKHFRGGMKLMPISTDSGAVMQAPRKQTKQVRP